MKISSRQLRRIIREALEIHSVPDDLSYMSPEEAYGVGYYAGKDYFMEESGKAGPFGSGMETAELEPDQKEIVGHT